MTTLQQRKIRLETIEECRTLVWKKMGEWEKRVGRNCGAGFISFELRKLMNMKYLKK